MLRRIVLVGLGLLGVAAGGRALAEDMITMASGVRYHDEVVGSGPEPQPGQSVTVQYTGWLDVDGKRGRKFDSSRDRNQPFSFTLGQGDVIQGWDMGVATMHVGGKRTLVIPPALAYGDRGAGDAVPPDATLIFDIELLSAK